MTTLSKGLISDSTEKTFEIGKRMAQFLGPGDVLALIGELGSGKTVLIKGIASGFGYDPNEVGSASFVIVQEYKAQILIYHVDLYRLDDPMEIYEIDWEGILNSEALILIEWAEKAISLLPQGVLKVEFKILSLNTREIKISGDKRYQELIRAL
jgi:tRNA threonylcarbamoyladenosine biosynthesis protein TsaE